MEYSNIYSAAVKSTPLFVLKRIYIFKETIEMFIILGIRILIGYPRVKGHDMTSSNYSINYHDNDQKVQLGARVLFINAIIRKL